MRNGFIDELTRLSTQDSSIVLLTPDMGYSVFEGFAKSFPKRYFNVGISEQAMIGIASGLAMDGYLPYCYSLVPFVLYRSFEQVRTDVCANGLNVKIVGGGAGWSYETQGPSHHAIEDIAITRSMPNLTIFSPCDYFSSVALLRESAKIRGPVYLRLGKNSDQKVYSNDTSLSLDHNVLCDGKDVLIISTGRMTRKASYLMHELSKNGIRPCLIDLLTIKPINHQKIFSFLSRFKLVVTIEEHNIIGGIGSLIAELVVEGGLSVKLLKFGLKDCFCDVCGDTEFIDNQHSLSINPILQEIVTSLQEIGNF